MPSAPRPVSTLWFSPRCHSSLHVLPNFPPHSPAAKFPHDGSRIVILSGEGNLNVLTQEFSAAVEASLSYDGKRILFSGRRTSRESWNIWEMDLDGRNKRQITKDFGDCREPRYLATSSITPPDFEDKVRWITFTSNAANTWDEVGPELATALYAMNLEPIEGRGMVTRRSTFNLSSDFSPVVLSDGRILFTSRQRGEADKYPRGRYLLLASNWDGTGVNLFCGVRQGAAVKTMACQKCPTGHWFSWNRRARIRMAADAWHGILQTPAGKLRTAEQNRWALPQSQPPAR